MEVEFPYKLSGTQTDELGIRLGQGPYALIDSEGRGAVLNETQLRELAGALLQAADLLETAPANRRPTGDHTMSVNYTIYANGFSPGPVDHISFDKGKNSFRITSWTTEGNIVSVFTTDLHEVFDLAKAVLPRPTVLLDEENFGNLQSADGTPPDPEAIRKAASYLLNAFRWDTSGEGRGFWPVVYKRLLAYAEHLERAHGSVLDTHGNELTVEVSGNHIRLTPHCKTAHTFTSQQAVALIRVLQEQVKAITPTAPG